MAEREGKTIGTVPNMIAISLNRLSDTAGARVVTLSQFTKDWNESFTLLALNGRLLMPANKAYLRYASPLCVRSKDRDPSGLANPSSNSGGSQMCDALRIEIASPQTRTNLERY
jgi:hypothetical protein